MNFRSKRVLVPAALTAVLVGGGAVWATTANADDVSGSERDRVVTAALEAVPDGEAAKVETSDDPGEAYEVEVFRADGTEVDLALDADLAVVSRDEDADDRDDRDDVRDDRDDRDDRDADDRVLSATERERAEQAALAAVGGGVVTGVEASDDRGVAYEVEVVERDGTEHDVDLDTTYDVVDQRVDR